MRIGLGLGIGTASGGASEPSSLYTTADMVQDADGLPADIIDADSARLARVSPEGIGTLTITDGGVNGAKTITFDLSAYDGAKSGVTIIRVQVYDGGVAIAGADYSAAGPISLTHTFVNGSIVFRAPTNGRGGRMDNIFIAAA